MKNARLEAAALRAQVAQGGDPTAERRKAKNVITRFEEAARRGIGPDDTHHHID